MKNTSKASSYFLVNENEKLAEEIKKYSFEIIDLKRISSSVNRMVEALQNNLQFIRENNTDLVDIKDGYLAELKNTLQKEVADKKRENEKLLDENRAINNILDSMSVKGGLNLRDIVLENVQFVNANKQWENMYAKLQAQTNAAHKSTAMVDNTDEVAAMKRLFLYTENKLIVGREINKLLSAEKEFLSNRVKSLSIKTKNLTTKNKNLISLNRSLSKENEELFEKNNSIECDNKSLSGKAKDKV